MIKGKFTFILSIISITLACKSKTSEYNADPFSDEITPADKEAMARLECEKQKLIYDGTTCQDPQIFCNSRKGQGYEWVEPNCLSPRDKCVAKKGFVWKKQTKECLLGELACEKGMSWNADKNLCQTAEKECEDRGNDYYFNGNLCSRKSFVEYCRKDNKKPEIASMLELITKQAKSAISCTSLCCKPINDWLEKQNELNFIDKYGTKVDPAPLAGLNSLKTLYFHNFEITNLKALTDSRNNVITPLKSLSLSKSKIKSLEGLERLKDHLEILFLNQNQITDLKPLESLQKLRELYLANNQVSNLTPLTNLKSLSVLDLNANPVNDLNPISQLKLEKLCLENTKIDKDAQATTDFNRRCPQGAANILINKFCTYKLQKKLTWLINLAFQNNI